MPVNTQHSQYVETMEKWERCRDCYEGSDAVKKAGSKYLPELDSHKQPNGAQQYEAYKLRALFFNAVGRTVDGFAGAVFQKAPTVKLEPEQEDVLEPEMETELDENFAPKLDKDGKPLQKIKLGPDGQPVLKKKLGPDGKPLKKPLGKEDEELPIEETAAGRKRPKLDENGKPIKKLGPDGKPVVKLGPDGKPIVNEETGEEEYEDEEEEYPEVEGEGEPELDEDGRPKLGPDGKPIFKKTEVDEDTEEEPEIDEKTGKPKLDENGNPLMKQVGKPHVDEFGKPLMGPDGKPLRKPVLPKKKVNPVEKHLSDITLTGTPLDMFSFEALQEVLTTGRYGILVDMADTEDRSKQRPYWAGYEAESIVNWTTDRVDGEEQLLRVVLKEEISVPDPLDEFNTIKECRYRVLSLVDDEYIQEVWATGETLRKFQEQNNITPDDGTSAKVVTLDTKKNGGVTPYSLAEQRAMYNGEPTARPMPYSPLSARSNDWGKIEIIKPVRRGKALNFIPFFFINSTGVQATVSKPPLLDLVDLNLSHYRTMADLEHGRHFVALPTPWISGAVQDEKNTVQIGPSGVLILDKGGSAGMLEFSGAGLRALETADEQKRKMMAVLGARLLEEQALAAETATAVGMRHSGEQAVIRTISQVLEQQLTNAMRTHTWWMGTEKTPDDMEYVCVELSKDFYAMKMQPSELAQLLAALQADGISYRTFYYNLAVGGLTRPGVDVEEEQRDIANKAESPIEKMPNGPDMFKAGTPFPNPQPTPNPQPNPQFGLPNAGAPKKTPPKGVVPPQLAGSAAAAAAANAKAKGGSPFGRIR